MKLQGILKLSVTNTWYKTSTNEGEWKKNIDIETIPRVLQGILLSGCKTGMGRDIQGNHLDETCGKQMHHQF